MSAQDVAQHDVHEVTAQDVIDALRLALVAQDDPVRIDALVRFLVEKAPPSDGDRGVALLVDLIREGQLETRLRA